MNTITKAKKAVKTSKSVIKTSSTKTTNTISKKNKTSKWGKLPPVFKAKWIAALRSGKYEQGPGRLLSSKNTWCCLGVAGTVCEIGKEHLLNKGTFDKFKAFNGKKLSKEHKMWNHLVDTRVPSLLKNDDLQSKLANMNDNGRSFKYIANWIEKYL